MKCSRLDHFAKIETGAVPLTRCCHMANPPRFNTVEEMENSIWLKDITTQLDNDIWPDQCVRCEQAESAGLDSVRTISNAKHNELKAIHSDYLVVDVVVDTICNAACIICSEDLSSTIAKLVNVPINAFEGLSILQTIPRERIVQLDVLGGEPGASKKSQFLLQNLEYFPNLQSVHISTNGSMRIKEIERLLEKGIRVDLVISMDGTKRVFEYCRFPLEWDRFSENMNHYKQLQAQYPNLSLLIWTSISAASVADLPNMLAFAKQLDIPLNGAPVQFPAALSINRTNAVTLKAKQILLDSEYDFANKIAPLVATDAEDNTESLQQFLATNDAIRKIDYRDYLVP